MYADILVNNNNNIQIKGNCFKRTIHPHVLCLRLTNLHHTTHFVFNSSNLV